ncbi:MAG: DUF3040 domain-containing protein [Candidatus Nanopelagicales bacterium]
MPLSDHEQRLLEQMERALYAEDPKFATSMRNSRGSASDRRRVAVGIVALLAGLGLLIAGVASKFVPIGVLGFLAMLGGLWLAINAFSGAQQKPDPAAQGAAPGAGGGPGRPTGRTPRPKPRSGESLSDRMEERWRKRRETGDF